MARALLDRELHELRDDVLVLGSMTEKAIRRAVSSLDQRDVDLAAGVISGDLEVNRKRFAIEEKCVQIMATQAPMAADLRTILAALYIITELERMADHGEGIARITMQLRESPPPPGAIISRIVAMAEKATAMLDGSLEAFLQRDADLALKVSAADDEVDDMYETVTRDLIGEMIRVPAEVTPLTYVMWAAHNLERIADRATNICEQVIFQATGRKEEINVSRY